VASVADDARFIALMAVYTPFHPHRLLRVYHSLQCDISMTALALYLRSKMFGVAEKHKVGHFVDAARGDCPLGHPDMTHMTLLHRGESRQIAARGSQMARNTRLL
jgi:hypothetical protein